MRNLWMGLTVGLLLVLGACSAPTGPEQPYPGSGQDDSGASDSESS